MNLILDRYSIDETVEIINNVLKPACKFKTNHLVKEINLRNIVTCVSYKKSIPKDKVEQLKKLYSLNNQEFLIESEIVIYDFSERQLTLDDFDYVIGASSYVHFLDYFDDSHYVEGYQGGDVMSLIFMDEIKENYRLENTPVIYENYNNLVCFGCDYSLKIRPNDIFISKYHLQEYLNKLLKPEKTTKQLQKNIEAPPQPTKADTPEGKIIPTKDYERKYLIPVITYMKKLNNKIPDVSDIDLFGQFKIELIEKYGSVESIPKASTVSLWLNDPKSKPENKIYKPCKTLKKYIDKIR